MNFKIKCIELLFLFVVSIHSAKVTVPGLGDIIGSETTTLWTNRRVYQFLSIPYALPPTGERRFVAPVALTSFDGGFYNATVQRGTCPQLSDPKTFNYTGSDFDLEDCLRVNVFTPVLPLPSKKKLLPVMVLIHGGRYIESGAYKYQPYYLLEKDVLLVVLQYRLGPLGFLSMQTDKIPGNAGFLDQIEGLKWVNKYISNFGGDNTKVTIMGHSAGGSSVSLLLFSPLVNSNLFQQVIVQSSPCIYTSIMCKDSEKYVMNMYSGITNITNETDMDLVESTLRNATVKEFTTAVLQNLEKDPALKYDLGCAVIQRAGDIKLIPDTPENLLKDGKYLRLPMLTGVAKHDGSFLLAGIFDVLAESGKQNNSEFLRTKLINQILSSLGISDLGGATSDMFENIYFKKLFDQETQLTLADMAPGLIDMLGAINIKAPTLKHAKLNSLLKKTFLYTFDYKGEHSRFGYETDTSKYPFKGGVHHSDDMLYLFKYPFHANLNKNDTRVAKIMVDLWTSFATDGTPFTPGKKKWSPIKTGRNGPYYHIDAVPHIGNDFVDAEYNIEGKEIYECDSGL